MGRGVAGEADARLSAARRSPCRNGTESAGLAARGITPCRVVAVSLEVAASFTVTPKKSYAP